MGISLTTFDAVLYAITFIVPGFVWSSVMSMLVPRRVRGAELRWLEFLTLSCINHAFWLWLLIPVFTTGFLTAHPIASGVLLVLPVLASPVVLVAIVGRYYQTGWVTRFLEWLGFRTVQLIPTAWDYQFSRGLPYWVIVTLKD